MSTRYILSVTAVIVLITPLQLCNCTIFPKNELIIRENEGFLSYIMPSTELDKLYKCNVTLPGK